MLRNITRQKRRSFPTKLLLHFQVDIALRFTFLLSWMTTMLCTTILWLEYYGGLLNWDELILTWKSQWCHSTLYFCGWGIWWSSFIFFAYLKTHHDTEMVFDPMPVDFDQSLFQRQDWLFSPYGYAGLEEEMPPGMLTPHGPKMTKRVYNDSNHAGDLVTWCSWTGFIVFLNNALIYWSSKKQGSCETRMFGSKFVAMKQAT